MAYPTINKTYAQIIRNVTMKVGRKIKYIVTHYTGTGACAENNCKYFSSGNRNASADFFIDKDGTIWQFNADIANYYTWHCGDGKGKYGITNANSIGIEVVSSGEEYTQAQKDALRSLVAALMADYGVEAANVVRHYDASRKICPAPYCGNTVKNMKWNELHAYITGGKAATSTATTDSKPVSKAGLDVDGLWGQSTTKAVQKALGTPVDGIVSGQSATDFNKANKGGLLTSSWKMGKGGSPMVKALQKKIGAKADGYFGVNTCKALQKHLGTTADGCASKPSAMVKELQRRLNNGTF